MTTGGGRGARFRVQTAALRSFRALPAPVRRVLVRAVTPSYTVGAVAAIACGERLLVLRQPHRPGWSLPGGLLSRGETAHAGVEREVLEETGLRIEVGLPLTTVVAPDVRRVDVVFGFEVAECVPVTAGGEALHAEWVALADVAAAEDIDDATRGILEALEQTRGTGAYGGRLLDQR